MSEPPLSRSTWLWAALGLAGSLLVAYAAPRALDDHVVGWWYMPATPAGASVSRVLVYAGMAALCVAWLGLGVGQARKLPSQRVLLIIAALWALPLALAPPLFSRDLYSYLAQGTILHLGHNPYRSSPEVLAGLGRGHVLAAVSPFWRHTTAPYGPLFLGIISLLAGATGSHLIGGVLLIRLFEAVGFVALALAMPRLTRATGTDPRRALWLALLSPLVMLQLVAAGHNDILMVGILAVGVATALDGNPLLGIAVCALAATIKVPALAGAVFIAVAWGRAERSRADQLRFGLAALGLIVVVLGVVTLVTGVGVSWISTGVLSTPAKVRLAITPTTGIGYTLASLLHDVGLGARARGWEHGAEAVGVGVTVVAGLVALWRVRIGRLLATLGGFLLIAAAAGPAAWPWYFIWGLALIAALRGVQRSTAVAVAIVVASLVVKPSGILALPLRSAPAVLVVYLAVAVAAWYLVRGRGGPGRVGSGDGRAAPGRAAGVEEDARSPASLAG
ncbi:MAG TPA: polyprenol phosphomannose-dependent alpha 1,6 mannosyltransferase MptB [Solirubrobacteraceae bacterium]|jgi:hypothetical protein|nr:polyprenol phosphomannose-dependent alpha 1,6 mannosyltransferase MptB [Solirubrobacteraceae bacterium]